MAEDDKESSTNTAEFLQRLAVEGQVKFTYFMVGLAFAIVGLSIQTGDQISPLTESSWLALIVSGLSGILRLSWNSIAFKANLEKLRAEDVKSELERAALSGTKIMVSQSNGKQTPIEKMIEGRKTAIEEFKKVFDEIAWKQTWRYNIQIWSFVAGILGLASDKIFLN